MYISKKIVSASTAAAIIVTIGLQCLGTAQAEQLGYVQQDCPNLVKQALDAVSAQCTKAGRNKLCYGNSPIQADFQANAGNVTFQSPGDQVDIAQIRQITLGGMDLTANRWGIAEMKIRADLPDTDPSQSVTFIMFGNARVSDAAASANTELTAIALTPTATSTALATFPASVQTQMAAATKQSAAHAEATGTKLAAIIATATAKASTPTPTGTISALHATQAAATATRFANILATAATALPTATATSLAGVVTGGYNTMQAFYFQSTETAGCSEAPHDGLLIQSPQGKQRVSLSVDGISVDLGSTVFLQAQPGKFLTVNTLEGSAQVTANGKTQTANPGLAVQVPLDANLRPAGPPNSPQFYTADTVRGLPVRVLPAAITVVPGLPAGTVFGTWNWRYYGTAVATGPCKSSQLPGNITFPVSIAVDATGGTARISYQNNGDAGVFTRAADGSYTGTIPTPAGGDRFTFHFSSSTQLDGSVVNSVGACTYTLTYRALLASGTGLTTPVASAALTPTP